jgi:transposase
VPGFSQERLSRLSVLCAGAGGLASHIGEALVRKGVGRLIVTDADTVELSNLNRQRFYQRDIWKNKALRLARSLRAEGFLGTEVVGIGLNFMEAMRSGMVPGFDVIVSGIDNEFNPVNGNAVVDILDGSRLCNVRDFLRTIKNRNPGKHILLFLDNFQSRISKHTKLFAESIGVTLAFIPKYSPDPHPIVFIWKAVRRRISQICFIGSEWSFRESVRTTFCRLAREKSFMAGGLEKFQPCLSKGLCH